MKYLFKYNDMDVYLSDISGIVFKLNGVEYYNNGGFIATASDDKLVLFKQISLISRYPYLVLDNSRWGVRNSYHSGLMHYVCSEFYELLMNNEEINSIVTIHDILE